jgi:hypothetical protein
MGERPRIVKTIIEKIEDPNSYTQNSCSLNARKFHEYSSDLVVELWIDKHCTLRQVERSGIDIDTLQNLAIESVKHIIYYQLRLQKFNIVQYPEHRGRDKRVLVQEITDEGVLNLILEYHYLDLCRYEVTIITAMVDDNFGIFDGQYILNIDGESSTLKRKIVGKISDVSSFGV